MQELFLVTAIIGFIEFVKAVNASNYQTAEIIAGAALIGGIAGLFGIDHLTIVTGIQGGLAAAGTYKGLSLAGGLK